MAAFTFTVFTGTYNRAHTLPRTYQSLCGQTYRNFEWLIVDDGSSDNTSELISRWQREGVLPIRSLSQTNLGKHVAFNRAVREAAGELFLTMDSDDECVPTALERFHFHWQTITPTERVRFSGVTCNCMDEKGTLIGDPFPANVIDSDPIQIHGRFNVKGDKWGFHRTDVLSKFPFPEIRGEKFIPEGIVWNRMAREYRIRYVNETLRVVRYLEDGISSSSALVRINSPHGSRMFYKEYCSLPVPLSHRCRSAINYFRFSRHAGLSLTQAAQELKEFPTAKALAPMGYLASQMDIWRDSSRRLMDMKTGRHH